MSFHVGQKVVRIKTEPQTFTIPTSTDVGDTTEFGVIYEVRWVGAYDFIQPDGTNPLLPACRLIGVLRRTKHPTTGVIKDDVPFSQRLFRPLQEEKKEERASAAMEIFRRIAANPQIEIKEDA